MRCHSVSLSVSVFPWGFLRDLIEGVNEKTNKGPLFSPYSQHNPP